MPSNEYSTPRTNRADNFSSTESNGYYVNGFANTAPNEINGATHQTLNAFQDYSSSSNLTNGVHANGVNGNSINAVNEVFVDGINGFHGYNSHNSLTNDNSSPITTVVRDEYQSGSSEPIAIVGMAMRLPGGVRNPQSFWESLVEKKDVRSKVPKDRYNVDAFHNEFRKPESTAANSGFFLEDIDLQNFDSGFFNLSKKEIDRLDPQQRLLLEVTWECMENGGQTKWRGKNIGCYIGVFGEDWMDMQTRDTQDMGLYRITGHNDFTLSNRISYEYDFKGPR